MSIYKLFILSLIGCLLIPSAAIARRNKFQLREKISMSFATILADYIGDTITLTPSGSISGTNTSLFIGSPVAGRFSARGHKNTAVSISFSAGDILSGVGSNMSLGNFVHDAGSTATFNSTGRLIFNVGASLKVNPTQAGGAYSGSYTVFVDYQ